MQLEGFSNPISVQCSTRAHAEGRGLETYRWQNIHEGDDPGAITRPERAADGKHCFDITHPLTTNDTTQF